MARPYSNDLREQVVVTAQREGLSAAWWRMRYVGHGKAA